MSIFKDSRSPSDNEDFACRAGGLQSLDTGSRNERGPAHGRPSKKSWNDHQIHTTRLLSQESQTSFIDPSLLTGAVSSPMTIRSMPDPPQDQLGRFAGAQLTLVGATDAVIDQNYSEIDPTIANLWSFHTPVPALAQSPVSDSPASTFMSGGETAAGGLVPVIAPYQSHGDWGKNSSIGWPGSHPAANALQDMAYSIQPFMPPTCLPPHSCLAGEWTQEQQRMLIRLRQEGHSYVAIADSIQKELNVSVTPNALVKRYHKIQELYLEPFAEATKNVMPQIEVSIKAEMERMGFDVSNLDKEALEELPKIVNKWLQNRASRSRRTMSFPEPS